jgi:iron complex outermembrane receptor protein
LNANHSVYSSIGIGHKEPTRDDYINSPKGNHPLPESMTDVELGYNASYKKIKFTLGGYLMTYKDQLVVTGKINDIGLYPRQNVAHSYRSGIEFELGYRPMQKIQFEFNITYSTNKIEEYTEYVDDYDLGVQKVNTYKNTDIAFSPSWISAGTITYFPHKNVEISFIGKYVGDQYLDNTQNTNRMISAYFNTDFRFTYALSKIVGKHISVTLASYNIFDSVFESNGYTYSYVYGGVQTTENYYYPQAGRHFMAGVQVKF